MPARAVGGSDGSGACAGSPKSRATDASRHARETLDGPDMSLRIGFDMDGVLADFSLAYHQVEKRLFGAEESARAGNPEEEKKQPDPPKAPPPRAPARKQPRRRDAIWAAIRETPDFWIGLEPIDPGAVRRLPPLMLRHRREGVFITPRPR